MKSRGGGYSARKKLCFEAFVKFIDRLGACPLSMAVGVMHPALEPPPVLRIPARPRSRVESPQYGKSKPSGDSPDRVDSGLGAVAHEKAPVVERRLVLSARIRRERHWKIAVAYTPTS